MIAINQVVQEKSEKTLNAILETIKKVGLITLIISVISSLSFLITYSFLFGYYFGGDLTNSISNFELIRTFIPFDLNTILFTYLLIGLSTTLIMYLIQIFLLKDIFSKIAVLALWISFHFILTAFFTKDFTTDNIIKFSIIWIFPLLSSILILFLVRGIKSIFKISAGSLFGFLTCLIFIIWFQDDVNGVYMEVLLLFLILIFGILFTFLPFKKLWNVLFVFPFALLIVLLVSSLVTFDYYQNSPAFLKLIIILLSSVLISWWVSTIPKKLFVNREVTEEPNHTSSLFNRIIIEITRELLNPKTHKKASIFLIIFLLAIYVLLPRLSTYTGKVIREYTPESELQFHSIEVITPDGSSKTFEGIAVVEKDDILYISNHKWELEHIKTEQYYILKE